MKRNQKFQAAPRGLDLFSDADAKNWLKACLDPYHDFVLESAGLPDERVTPSVVKLHNQSYTLTAPTNAAGGAWDASVLYTGFNTRISTAAQPGLVTLPNIRGLHALYDSSAISSGQEFGALNIWAGAAGSTMSTGAPVTTGDTYAQLGSVQAIPDRCRLLAVGFEIHNTTAEIYKQGSLTVAQLPDPIGDSHVITYHDTNAVGPWPDQAFQAFRGPLQASTLPSLLAVPGSQTWPLAKGVYAIPRMAVVPRETCSFGVESTSKIPILMGTDGKAASPTVQYSETVDGVIYPLLSPYSSSGFTPIQVFVSGASNQTALTITLRTIVEYFPGLDSGALPLATPSPAYDPRVFEIYGRIVAEAPYAVPVGQNAGGDYFRKIMYALSQALSLGSPYLGAYGPLAKAAGSLGIDRFAAKPVSGGGGKRMT